MATIEEMMAKNEKDFQNLELDVILKSIMTADTKGKITLIFYAPDIKSEYRKNYLINDVKGRVDFNRAMYALGCSKNNYGKWLDKLMHEKTIIRVSINENGFIRYIKVIEKSKKEHITKCLLLDNIEGLSKEDRDFLMTLNLNTLKKEFGHQ